METRHVGHSVATDVWSNRFTMGLWAQSFRMSGTESHNFSRLHKRRFKFRLRLFSYWPEHVRHRLGNHFCFQSNLSGLLIISSEKFQLVLFIASLQILSVIFFFSFFVNILYYYGIMQWVVQKLGWLLQVSVGTTAAESMNAAANIFLGQVSTLSRKTFKSFT